MLSKGTCLSVRLNPVLYQNGLIYRRKTPDSLNTVCSFLWLIIQRNEIPTGSPLTGALNTGGV